MKKVLVTYGDENYRVAKETLIRSAKRIHYFDEIYGFGPEEIDESFRREHADILSVSRGNGLWLWKPYFIVKTLKQLEYGDILFYSDAGALFLKSPESLESRFEDIFVSDIPLLEWQFTKGYVQKALKVPQHYMESNQIIASYLIVRKTKRSEYILNNWLSLCEDQKLLSPSCGEMEVSDFIAHREDQSLLSVLCKRENVRVNWDITQRKYLPYTYWNPNYRFVLPDHGPSVGVFLLLHKNRNPTVVKIMLVFLKQIYVNLKNYSRQKNIERSRTRKEH